MSQNETCDGCGYHFANGDEVMSVFARHYAEYVTEWYLCVECTHQIHKVLTRINRKRIPV